MNAEDFSENYITGWIKIYRSVKSHWIWTKNKPLSYFEAWILIILSVNYSDEKVLIDSELIECKRGQKLYSLQSWANMFNWSIQKVRTFFRLLSSDNMIELEGLRKTTRLTVCNYESYQSQQQTDNKQITSRQQADNKQITTSKEYKNEKNINTKYIDAVYFEKSKEVDDAFRDYLKLRIKHKYTMTDRAIKALVKKLREIAGNDVNLALKTIDNAILGKWKSFYSDKKIK